MKAFQEQIKTKENVQQYEHILFLEFSFPFVRSFVPIFSSEGALYVILPYDYQAPPTFWTHTGP